MMEGSAEFAIVDSHLRHRAYCYRTICDQHCFHTTRVVYVLRLLRQLNGQSAYNISFVASSL